jgi:hypothetical protein
MGDLDPTHFVEFLITASTPIGQNSNQFFVQTLDNLFFSDDPPPQPANPTFPTGPINVGGVGPPIPLPGPHPLPHPNPLRQFIGSDGTVIQATPTVGEVSQLQGTSKSGDKFTLTLLHDDPSAPGRQQKVKVVWARARMSITKEPPPPPPPAPPPPPDVPLVFGVAYSPTDALVKVFLQHGNVETGFVIDFGQLMPQADGSVQGTAKIYRDLNYYQAQMSLRELDMDANATDPKMYLPVDNAVWREIDKLQYFEDALNLLAGRTASNIPPMPRRMNPLAAMAAFALTPSVTEAEIVAQQSAWVGPALGPLAAEFVDPTQPVADALRSAALWCGWELFLGAGKPDLLSAFADEFKAWQAFLAEPSNGKGRNNKPTEEPTSDFDD